MSKNYTHYIKTAIEPLRKQLIQHPLYASIKNMDHIRAFMEYHVYAVWDFMSLLKSLQNQLTCTTVPWVPIGNANTRYLINEIVVGEESDVNIEGKRISHFEMYLDAMECAGADTTAIKQLISTVRHTGDPELAIREVKVPEEAADFLRFTFRILKNNQLHQIAAVFTFGREDLIPDIFLSIVGQLQKEFPEQISAFKYYIERHIEVDGGHHSHLALEMTTELCGSDPIKWQEALEASQEALKMRKLLWDGIQRRCTAAREVEV